ncbi:MAG TPA: hypothetical protein DD381_08655 [Lentisphaeria bacterium]|nr:MAG: hypothetical protein A2X47_08190 [Lentisphaerae bacterium GWF2_38_69]HBM16393.1 hypothetical protein [Lentisphaeria bacterium]
MKQNKIIKYLTVLFISLCFNASAEYFYMDKSYSDVLINNPLRADLTIADKNAVPQELQKFALTSGKINSNIPETLYPSEVISFSVNGDCSYIWMTGPSRADKISGKWKVENSQLIIYTIYGELRYDIVKIADPEQTKLILKGCSYPEVTKIIPSSDNPFTDFEKIAISIAEKKL